MGWQGCARRIARDVGEASERDLDDENGREVGLSGATVRRYLGLRELAPGVRDLLADGHLSVTQAQHLRAVTDTLSQEALAQLAARRLQRRGARARGAPDRGAAVDVG